MVNKTSTPTGTKGKNKKNGKASGATLKQSQLLQPQQQPQPLSQPQPKQQSQPQSQSQPQPQSQPQLKQMKKQQEQQQEQETTHHPPMMTPPVELKAPPMFNPVGELQEHCQKHLWPLPAYTFRCTGGNDPSRREFACTVDVFGKRERATGQSKRMAKRRAAAALLRQLVKTAAPAEPPQSAASPMDEATFQRLSVSKRLQLAGRAGSEIGGLFSGLRNRKAGTVLPPLEEPSARASAFEQLTELGRTHRFGVAFMNDGVSDKTGGQHRSIVKLSTMPTIVAVGSGSDAIGAREESCRAAMEYLCMLTKENQGSIADKK